MKKRTINRAALQNEIAKARAPKPVPPSVKNTDEELRDEADKAMLTSTDTTPKEKFELIKSRFEKGKTFSHDNHVLWLGDTVGLTPEQKFELIGIRFEKGFRFTNDNDALWLGNGAGLNTGQKFELIKIFFKKGNYLSHKNDTFWLDNGAGLNSEHKSELIKIHFGNNNGFSEENHALWLGDTELTPKQKAELVNLRKSRFSTATEDLIFSSNEPEVIKAYCAKWYPDIDVDQFLEND